MESSGGYGSRSSYRAVARKLLAAEAPSPQPAPVVCRDVKTGAMVRCQNPQTLVIIVAGMSCMMVLVTIATLLLCYSVVRQRRLDARRPGAQQTETPQSNQHELTGLAPPRTSSTTHELPALSPEYDDAVLVQLPGDEKPHFFALPKPFPAKDESSVKPESDDVAESGPKDPSEDEPNASDPCVLYRNPLFASQERGSISVERF